MPKSTFTAKYKNFRLKLIDSRQKGSLTQVELAARLKRQQSFVSKFERGERRLDVIEFFDVAQAIGIDPFVFLRELYPQPLERKRTSP